MHKETEAKPYRKVLLNEFNQKYLSVAFRHTIPHVYKSKLEDVKNLIRQAHQLPIGLFHFIYVSHQATKLFTKSNHEFVSILNHYF